MSSFVRTITGCVNPLPSLPSSSSSSSSSSTSTSCRATSLLLCRRPQSLYPPHHVRALIHTPRRPKKQPASVSCQAVDGNSTRSPSREGSEDMIDLEEEESSTSSSDPISASSDQIEAQESLGRALNELRKEKAEKEGKENPSKTEEFWLGVLEETRLIEWPSLQRVLSTTGVVVSIIFGSSLVLLTVNALLAELSDVVFKNTSVLPSPPL